MERGNRHGSNSLHPPAEYQSESLMPKSFLAILLAAAGLIAGCGSPELSSQVLKGTHSGRSIRLPEDKGYVELVNEPIVTDRRNPQPTSIVAYFFQTDGKSAMSPSPTDVSFQIDSDARSRQRDKSAASSSTLPFERGAQSRRPRRREPVRIQDWPVRPYRRSWHLEGQDQRPGRLDRVHRRSLNEAGNRGVRKTVTPGLDDDTQAEILSGLQGGEIIVKAFATWLTDGQPITGTEPEVSKAKPRRLCRLNEEDLCRRCLMERALHGLPGIERPVWPGAKRDTEPAD